MLDTIPEEFWMTKQKVFEPCSGKGGFLIDIVNRFSKYLDYKTIVEECLYFSDINPTNIYINKLLLDPDNKYNLNYNLGDTLKLDIKEKWGLNGFDAVIGNPPYNMIRIKKGSTNIIYNKFIIKSLNEWILKDKYLIFVTPSGWRKPESKLFKLMSYDNTMIKLFIRGIKNGKQTFNCGTRYDYYIIKKSINNNFSTYINDEKYIEHNIKLNEWSWIPNYNFNTIKKNFKKEN